MISSKPKLYYIKTVIQRAHKRMTFQLQFSIKLAIKVQFAKLLSYYTAIVALL